MKVITKIICSAAGLAGAFLLGSTAAVLLMNHRKASRVCNVFSCDCTAEQTKDNDITLQRSCKEEAKSSE